MNQFFAVLRFELTNYFKNKGYLITTGLIAVILIVGLSIPSFISIPGISSDKNETTSEAKSEDKSTFVIFDEGNVIKDINILGSVFENSEWKVVDSKDEVNKLIESDEAETGFIVKSPTEYSYIVKNRSFDDGNKPIFESVLSRINRENYLKEKNISVDEMDALYNTQITSDVEILGKDSVSNFGYTYGLIFVLYFMIIYYGQLIAVSVTNEKSNRAIEVLVTSTSSNSLIFGKVIAAAIASVVQVGVIIGSGFLSYKLNSDSWGGKLDMIFNIPIEVIGIFAVFGLLGYLFYSFIFGTLGALVSKTEDISKSASPVMMIFVFVFMAVMFSLTSPEGMLMKILSFVPFSSCMAMFVRVAMGGVLGIEVAISLAILVVSTGLVGIIGAKIYRRGTLMYGNPVKFTNALKWLKKE